MKYYIMDGSIFNEQGKEVGSKDKDGYVKFAVSNKTGTKQWLAHRYIWTKAHGDIPNGYDVDHIDFNPSNNKLENLQLVTRQQHRDRRQQKGTIIKRKSGNYQALRNNKHIGMFATICGAQMACNLYYI